MISAVHENTTKGELSMRQRPRLGRVALAALVAAFGLAQVPASAQPRIQPPANQPQQPPAQQQGGGTGNVIKGVNPEMTAEILKAAGYTNTEVYTTSSGAKHAAGEINGSTVSVLNLACKDGQCLVLRFMVNFGKQDSIDAKYMNAWAAQNLIGTLYTDPQGNLFFMWSIFVGDTTVVNVARSAVVFGAALKDLMAFKPQ
jgi:hypothetical protein